MQGVGCVKSRRKPCRTETIRQEPQKFGQGTKSKYRVHSSALMKRARVTVLNERGSMGMKGTHEGSKQGMKKGGKEQPSSMRGKK